MIENTRVKIQKKSGELVVFSPEKLKKSLEHSGASDENITKVLDFILENIYDGIPSHEVYKLAYEQLKALRSLFASKYRLKKAIYELGPSGFPFERLVSTVLHRKGYETKVGQILHGKCVDHEIDVLALKDKAYRIIECKFHSDEKFICNVKIPLYIHSRFRDLSKNWHKDFPLKKVWIVTNTRFSEDAIRYASCNKIKLLSWNYPVDNGLKKMLTDLKIYPLTTLSLLSHEEKQDLLQQNIVLCSDLAKNSHLLNKIGVSKPRKIRILEEIKELCHKKD